MSRQLEWIRSGNVLAGMTALRGNPWWVGNNADLYAAQLFDGPVPTEAVEKLIGFPVIESPVFVKFNGEYVQVDDRKAMMHGTSGDVFGIHTEGYVGHGYGKWLHRNVMSVTGDKAVLANVGLLNKGAVAYVQVEMPDTIDAGGGVKIRPYLLATTSFDGSIATTYKLGFTNVVCDNTYAAFLGEAGQQYRRKHTRNSEFDILTAASALDTLDLIAEQTTAGIVRLSDVDVSDKAWSDFLTAHAPTTDDKGESLSPRSISLAETKREALTGLWRTDIRVQPWAGTAWGVVQAVNTYNQHMSIIRNVDRAERQMIRAVKGEIGPADLGTLGTLGAILGRDLITV